MGLIGKVAFMSRKHDIIAIDGPAASGKSSVAQRVADQFGFLMVNSGDMYRAFTWHVLKEGLAPGDDGEVVRLLNRTQFSFGVENRHSTVAINGVNPGDELRSEGVNAAVSQVAAIPEVRVRLVQEQRRFAELGNVVMEGRDIGTVVFPDSRHKFYLDAREEVRARRRGNQGMADDIRGRDRMDSQRQTAPLRVADDARVIDTSCLSLDEVVGKVIQILRESGVGPEESQCQRASPWSTYFHARALCRVIFTTLYGVEAYGVEHAKFPGGALLASNHLSFLDPPLVGSRLDEPIYYLARKSLFRGRFMNWLLPRIHAVPVDQEKSDLASLRESIRLVREGGKLVIFPEGHRSDDGNLQPAQRGVGLLIAKTAVPVIPVRVFGTYEVYPNHAKFPRLHGKLRVVFGEPLRFSAKETAGRGKEGSAEIANRVMGAIAALKVPGIPDA